ncbi:MAG: SCO family protein [Pseudomonadota bacterium]
MTRVFAIMAFLAAVALVGLTYYLTTANSGSDQFAECRASQVAGGSAQIGGPFTLVSETGETVTDEEVIDKPSLIYFGYTFCPDVCSIDAARNAVAVDILGERGLDVKPIFISIDPERDTPEVMADYTDILHPAMIGLTGSKDQVKAASTAYRTFFQRRETGDEFYLMDHSTFSYLTMPNEGFVEFFRRDATPEEMADRIGCFMAAA